MNLHPFGEMDAIFDRGHSHLDLISGFDREVSLPVQKFANIRKALALSSQINEDRIPANLCHPSRYSFSGTHPATRRFGAGFQKFLETDLFIHLFFCHFFSLTPYR